jgi:ammonia channel protein AmtB
LAKNFVVFAVSSLAFLGLGFGLTFGDGTPTSWASSPSACSW